MSFVPITDKQKALIVKINIELGIPVPEDLYTWSRGKASSYIDDRIKESKKAREFACMGTARSKTETVVEGDYFDLADIFTHQDVSILGNDWQDEFPFFGARARRALDYCGCKTVRDVASLTRGQFPKKCGLVTILEIHLALKKHHISHPEWIEDD